MKVLFISRRFYPEVIGGGQVSAFYIAKSLKIAGAKVYVCTFTDLEEYSETDIEGVKIFRIPIGKIKQFPRLSNMDLMYFEMAYHASKIIKKIKPDVLHLLNFESIPGAVVYYKLRFNLPIFATVNGPSFSCFVQSAIDYKGNTCIKCRISKRYLCSKKNWGLNGVFYYIYSFWYMNLLKLSYKFVDRFFAVSHAMIPILENMGVDKKRISVVYNPVEKIKMVKTDLKKQLGIEGKKVILFVGRLTKAKGIERAIKAMPFIDNAVYLIVGKKRADYDYFANLVKELKLEDKVKFIGFVEPEKLVEYYSITDTCILVETFFEPLSRFLLEASLFNIPIIATDTGGNKEILSFNAQNNYLIDASTKISLPEIIKYVLFHKKKKKAIPLDFMTLKGFGHKLKKNYLEVLKNPLK